MLRKVSQGLSYLLHQPASRSVSAPFVLDMCRVPGKHAVFICVTLLVSLMMVLYAHHACCGFMGLQGSQSDRKKPRFDDYPVPKRLFAKLMQALEYRNPKAFQLPEELRNHFRHGKHLNCHLHDSMTSWLITCHDPPSANDAHDKQWEPIRKTARSWTNPKSAAHASHATHSKSTAPTASRTSATSAVPRPFVTGASSRVITASLRFTGTA